MCSSDLLPNVIDHDHVVHGVQHVPEQGRPFLIQFRSGNLSQRVVHQPVRPQDVPRNFAGQARQGVIHAQPMSGS